MVRLSSVFRLAAKASAGSESIFAKAIVRAAAKPRPPSQPQFTPQQSVTTPQWNAGTTFHPVQATNSVPFPGYGVYSPAYLESLALLPDHNQDEPYLFPDLAPENFTLEGGEDPFQNVHTVEPVDNVETDENAAAETAEEIVDDVASGKSIAQVAEEYGISPQDVLDQLEAGGLELEGTQSDDGSETTIKVVDGETGDTVAEYNFTEQQDGVVVEEATGADGETTTTVIDEDGNRTTLDPRQETTREGVDEIIEGVADGQSIDEIAREQGLDTEQVVAQLEAAGFEVESDVTGQGPSLGNTTEITDKESGEPLVHQETKPDGTTVSRRTDDDGNEVRHTVHPDGSTTTVVTEPDGRETETQVDADGKTTETVTYEQNGVTVEEVTGDDGETTTTIIDEDGERTTLDPGQETTREGIDGIAGALADGQSIDAIAEERDLTREQIEAQLQAAGYVIQSETNALGNGGEQYTTSIVDAEDGEVIASYSSGPGVGNSSLHVDADGNETRRTERPSGSTTTTETKANGREIKTTTNAEGETTREVTDNGYTLTTPPDGDLTLHRHEDGQEITIERGTKEQSMAEELLELDPDGSDEDRVLQAVIEEMLAERDDEGTLKDLNELEADLEDQDQAVEDALEEILGEDGDEDDVIKPGEEAGEDDPLGKPPSDEAPSGGDWVAMLYQGEWKWVDPAIAEALQDRESARLALRLAEAEATRDLSQLAVYGLDDDYEDAMDAAIERINELWAPHGLRWVPPDFEQLGLSLDDAEESLSSANTWIDYLEKEQEYQGLQEEADGLKGEVLEAYRNDEEYADYFNEEGFEETTESDSPGNSSGEQEHTGELLHQSVVQIDGQLYLRNIYADRDSPLDKPLTLSPDSDLSGLSDEQRRLNREWQELKLGEEPARLQEEALEAFRSANPEYFRPEGYSEERSGGPGGSYTWESGELTDSRVVERDGQLVVINTYGEGFEETTKELPLTYAPGDDMPEDFSQAQREANEAWQEFTEGKDIDEDLRTRILDQAREQHPDHFKPEGFTETTPQRIGDPLEEHSGERLSQEIVERDGQLFLVSTFENLDEPLETQLTFDPDSDTFRRTPTQERIDDDWARYKEYRYSSEDSLAGIMKGRNEAERAINEWLAEQKSAAAEAADAPISELEQRYQDELEEHGEGTVTPGGEEAERIEIDGVERWVHPDVAEAYRNKEASHEVLQDGEDITERAEELYGEQHPGHVDPDGFTFKDPDAVGPGAQTKYISTGAIMEADSGIIVGDDGQLYLRNVYEDEDEPRNFPLTYAPGTAPEGRSEEQLRLDREWADWWEAHGEDGEEDPLAAAQQTYEEAQEAYGDQVERYGTGTTRELTEALPDGVDPVLVTIDEQVLDPGGLQIMDPMPVTTVGEQRSVHPDVAMALRALEAARSQRESSATAAEEMALAAVESDYRASRPSTWKLLNDGASAEHEMSVQAAWQMEEVYLEANGEHGSLTQARTELLDSQEALLTTEEGLVRAGFEASGEAMELAMASGVDSVDLANGLQAGELSDVRAQVVNDREELQESAQWNDHLRQDYSLDDRLDPENGHIIEDYYKENPEVARTAIEDRLEALPESIKLDDDDAREVLDQALGSDDEELVDAVEDQLREIGGDNVEVGIIPILYRDSHGVRDTALFTVEDGDGKTWLVDESGSKYRNFEDYRQNNYLSDKGHVFLPESPSRLTDASDDLTYGWYQARELSFTEQWLDPVIGIGTGIATVAAFIPPLAPIAAPIAFAGGAYFGARSVSNIHEMHEHGRPLASTEGMVQGAMLATSFLPMGASAFRVAGLTRAGTPTGVAVRTSTGAVNTWGKAWSQNPMYQEAAEQLTQRGVAFSTARGLDRAAMGVGIPLMGYSGVNLATKWQDMTGLERSDALIGLGSGLFGAGMGYQASRAARPNQGAPESLALGKLPARHGEPLPPPGLSRLYRLGDLEALNQASVDGTLPAGYHIHFVQPGRLDSTNFVLREGTVLRGGRVDGDGHIQWPKSRREQPLIYTLSNGDNGRQTVHIQESGNGRILRSRDFVDDAYILVTDKWVSQLRGMLKPTNQDTLPFTLYNGTEGNWGSARSYENAIRRLLLSAGTLGGAISLGGPPEISMPLNALAYGVRGTLLGIQAVFPNATAVDTGLGRLLRGGVFLTFAINVPGTVGNYTVNDGQYQLQLPDGGLGWANAGQEWVYALGNSGYMLKAFDEASTGRSARSWVNDAALPLFVAGGAEGLASSAWTSGWPPDAMTGYNATTNAMLAGGATRLWIRDGVVGKKVGSWLSSHMPQLSGIAKFNKRDVATLIGFTGTLIPAAAMGMKDYFNDQINTEDEDIDSELSGYVPSDFSPPQTPPSGGKADNVPPRLADVPTTFQPLAEEIQLVVLDRQGTVVHTDPVGVSPVVTHYPHGTFLEQMGGRVTDGDGNEWVPVRLGSDGEPVGWTMAQGVTEHSSGAMGESGRFNPDYEGRYAAVTVEPHQTLGGIAVRKGHDIEQVVVLNLGHIIDPGVIYPGDRVYLPERQSAI
ncbi:hypothetical protein OCT51_04690 [Halomonas sp. LR3S48]|uniref:hypothetical protein n=1 Tax=Halomonas sp. LR3S48 TaxID=2982694 RepID=UPI0021E4A491|nr:hypothetical protein [Halomonas sp. LR3S48]UYG04671.1 hypothetical protein OCT51_04690 [Halomonas sp. LR3S48]